MRFTTSRLTNIIQVRMEHYGHKMSMKFDFIG